MIYGSTPRLTTREATRGSTPELLLHAHPCSEASDVYALGYFIRSLALQEVQHPPPSLADVEGWVRAVSQFNSSIQFRMTHRGCQTAWRSCSALDVSARESDTGDNTILSIQLISTYYNFTLCEIMSRKGFDVESNKMNWSQEKNVEFIEEYRKLAVLWDIRLADYKNNHAKLDALWGLAEKFNCDVAMVKNIKNLRTAFRHEHKSLTQKKSGSSPIKRSKWFAYDLLIFLLDMDIGQPKAWLFI
ncbi:hypothetical protein GWK47_024670 [Chionoecetes opilio]|uniref:MADF domain-containing protein n=1 Tax=Chionoecetes opilio TaxID=41210 RepID=A0A8J5CJ51_CHIOP|nr:hypothetical protein GWK47_024670 [Chionoecetes opilio]